MSSPFPPSPSPGGQPPNPFGPPGPSGPSHPTPPNPFAPSQPSFGPPPSSFPPSGPTSTYEPYPGPASRLSLLAVASMIFGTGGFLTCCCAIFGIPSSLLAIATGHTALIFINRSDSKLTGKVPAAIGLVGGYLGLLISVGFLLVGAFSPEKKQGPVAEAPRHTTADDLLNVAENKIRTDSGGIAHGNTDEAKALAQEFSEFIQVLRDNLFTKDDGGISLSGGKFITYCELRPGQCAFLVHVPDYRNFEDDAKESLAKLAWLAAQKTVADDLEPGDKLAVGMKGAFLYGSVMVGKVSEAEGEEAGLEIDGKDRDELFYFFEPEDESATELNVEMPGAIELPAQETPPADESGKPEKDSDKPADSSPDEGSAPSAEIQP